MICLQSYKTVSNKAMFSFIIVCVLVLHNFEIVHSKTCDDCLPLHQCVEAAELKDIDVNSTCGSEDGHPKVCCSDYLDAENHPNVALLPNDCGKISSSRVTGDRNAGIEEFPWTTVFYATSRRSFTVDPICGGSIINSKYILTTAICAEIDFIYGACIGAFDIKENSECELKYTYNNTEWTAQNLEIASVIIHPQFQQYPQIINDIALIRLKTPIDFSTKNAAPVCLPVTKKLRNSPLVGKLGTIAGWNERNSSTLIKSKVSIISKDVCQPHYNKTIHDLAQIICIDELDNGFCLTIEGPLTIEEEYTDGVNRMIQYGIMTYDYGFCRSNIPLVYTDVSKYMKWILDNISA